MSLLSPLGGKGLTGEVTLFTGTTILSKNRSLNDHEVHFVVLDYTPRVYRKLLPDEFH